MKRSGGADQDQSTVGRPARRSGRWLRPGPLLSVAALLVLMLWLRPAQAQSVVFASSSFNSGGAQASWSHTVPAGGQNRYLLVGVSINHTNQTPVVTTVSFVPTSLPGMNVAQALAIIGGATSTGQLRTEIWGLAAPAEATGSVTVRLDGPGGFVAGALSFTGVHQSLSTGPFVSNLGTGTTASLSVPSAAGEAIVSVQAGRGVVLPVARSPHQGRWSFQGLVLGAGGYEPGRAGATVFWDTPGANQPWMLAGLSVKPALVIADAGPPDVAPDIPPPPDLPPDSSAPPPDTGTPPPDAATPDTGEPAPDTGAETSPGDDVANPPRPDAADDVPGIPDGGPPGDGPDAAPDGPVTDAADTGAPLTDAGVSGNSAYNIGCACRLAPPGPSTGGGQVLSLLAALLLVIRSRRARRRCGSRRPAG